MAEEHFGSGYDGLMAAEAFKREAIVGAKIGDMVEIQSGYASFVDLGLELRNERQNLGRMTRYRPVKSHRMAFERLARSLNVMDRRCYLLTGSYGTGKSHLCLMFANYLQTPSGKYPMTEFFGNYAEVDRHAAENLAAKRSTGRYLVALCQWGGRGDFDEIVLRAVDEALKLEGFGEDLDTEYLQALKRIEEWERLRSEGDPRGRFADELESALEEQVPPTTPAQFKRRLREYDAAALRDFKEIHKHILTTPFTYDKSELIDVLKTTLASERFKERFLGILVLFDEMGHTMQRGNLSPTMFQQLAQLATETPPGSARLIFVGTAHRALTDYGTAYSKTDFQTVSDRV